MHAVIPYVIAALLFGLGVYGVLRRRNAILVLMAVELMLNAVNLLFVACLAFLIGVLTDAPLGAVGGAVLVTIVSNILDSIGALGDVREALPTHYQFAWAATLQADVPWTDMATGALWSVGYAVVLLSAGFVVFERKDVLS